MRNPVRPRTSGDWQDRQISMPLVIGGPRNNAVTFVGGVAAVGTNWGQDWQRKTSLFTMQSKWSFSYPTQGKELAAQTQRKGNPDPTELTSFKIQCP